MHLFHEASTLQKCDRTGGSSQDTAATEEKKKKCRALHHHLNPIKVWEAWEIEHEEPVQSMLETTERQHKWIKTIQKHRQNIKLEHKIKWGRWETLDKMNKKQKKNLQIK